MITHIDIAREYIANFPQAHSTRQLLPLDPGKHADVVNINPFGGWKFWTGFRLALERPSATGGEPVKAHARPGGQFGGMSRYFATAEELWAGAHYPTDPADGERDHGRIG